MKTIPLTQGQVALVDDEDFVKVSALKWCAHYQRNRRSGEFNAVSNQRINGKVCTVLMHRIVMDAPNGVMVDHIDRNPLNNQKANLRLANHSQNGMNQGLRKNNTSGYKGVYFFKRWNKFVAQIKVQGRAKNLGGFDTAIEAAKKYNEVALQEFGEYAVLNQIEETENPLGRQSYQ